MHGVQKCGLLLLMCRGPFVCLSVCLLDITMSCAKMAELIERTFGMWTRMGQRNHLLHE